MYHMALQHATTQTTWKFKEKNKKQENINQYEIKGTALIHPK